MLPQPFNDMAIRIMLNPGCEGKSGHASRIDNRRGAHDLVVNGQRVANRLDGEYRAGYIERDDGSRPEKICIRETDVIGIGRSEARPEGILEIVAEMTKEPVRICLVRAAEFAKAVDGGEVVGDNRIYCEQAFEEMPVAAVVIIVEEKEDTKLAGPVEHPPFVIGSPFRVNKKYG